MRENADLSAQSKTGWLICFCLLTFVFCLRAWGQSYSIDWYKIAGGGGTSTGGVYPVSGTIGQPDAGGAMTGGNLFAHGRFLGALRRANTRRALSLGHAHHHQHGMRLVGGIRYQLAVAGHNDPGHRKHLGAVFLHHERGELRLYRVAAHRQQILSAEAVSGVDGV